jgi:hypothetical protein
MAGRASVPKPEPGDAIRVDVLWRALKLCENGQVVARVIGERVRNFQQNGAIALDDQGAIGHSPQSYARNRQPLAC